ncbi:MAG: hypothetical protein C5B51_14155 [Terriglobia bacterium]|nr:MAG: hypothetical protein C5B51_14155 [Terriglobia bacterium]
MRLLVVTVFLGIFSLAALAADITGKWVAQVPGPNGSREITFDFKQAGNDLTGSIAGPRGAQEISEGKVQGENVSFAVVLELTGNQIRQNFKGTISGNQIRFTRDAGRGGPVEFTAKKQ